MRVAVKPVAAAADEHDTSDAHRCDFLLQGLLSLPHGTQLGLHFVQPLLEQIRCLLRLLPLRSRHSSSGAGLIRCVGAGSCTPLRLFDGCPRSQFVTCSSITSTLCSTVGSLSISLRLLPELLLIK